MQRMSRLFARTLRDDPVEATIVSHRLLLRAGYIRPLGAGIYSMLPLGWRVQRGSSRSCARKWTAWLPGNC